MINIINTKIEDVKIIEPKVHLDDRGYFFESYNQNEFYDKVGKINFVQDNESSSSFGVLRGMHYQVSPFEQSKLIRVIKGEVQDVVVDLRKDSTHYLKYISIILNEKNKKQLFVPKGFAHGFLVLSKYATVHYKVDNFYNKESERMLLFNSLDINIKWELEHNKIKLSDKDKGV